MRTGRNPLVFSTPPGSLTWLWGRTQRALAHQWLSDLIEPLNIQTEPQRMLLQCRSKLLRFVLERLLVTPGQGLCRRHRSPPRSRHIAAER